MGNNFKLLAITFHSASEQMRSIQAPEILGADGEPIPENPVAVMARAICADCLQTIGNVYLGLAVNEEEPSDGRETVQ